MSKKIYISPSDQTDNAYAVGNTTEAEQCRKVALALVEALKRCGFEARTNTADGSEAMDNRIAESNSWGADLHMPLHTNACNGKVKGTRMFCYSKGGEGYKVAKCVMETFGPITPGDSDNITEYPGLAEIRRVAAPTCYIEMIFHDNAEEARWMINNTAEAAEAICKGVCNYYGVMYVAPENKPVGRYETLEQCPSWAKPTVKKLMDKGILHGTSHGLDLSYDMLRMLVMNDRAGLYD